MTWAESMIWGFCRMIGNVMIVTGLIGLAVIGTIIFREVWNHADRQE